MSKKFACVILLLQSNSYCFRNFFSLQAIQQNLEIFNGAQMNEVNEGCEKAIIMVVYMFQITMSSFTLQFSFQCGQLSDTISQITYKSYQRVKSSRHLQTSPPIYNFLSRS